MPAWPLSDMYSYSMISTTTSCQLYTIIQYVREDGCSGRMEARCHCRKGSAIYDIIDIVLASNGMGMGAKRRPFTLGELNVWSTSLGSERCGTVAPDEFRLVSSELPVSEPPHTATRHTEAVLFFSNKCKWTAYQDMNSTNPASAVHL